MSHSKKNITALTEISLADLDDNDVFVIVDVSDTSQASTGTTKRITKANLLASSV